MVVLSVLWTTREVNRLSWEWRCRPGDVVKALFEKKKKNTSIRGFEIDVFEKTASCSNSQENILTGVFSSTMKTVMGIQLVREKLSTALLF